MIERARKVVPTTPALLAQIAGQARGLLARKRRVRCEGLDPRAPVTVCVAPRVRRFVSDAALK
jgi:hypothetical protein